MKNKFIRFFLFVMTGLALVSFDFDKAEGWGKAGSKPNSYDMGIDKGAGQDGKNCASIKSKDKRIQGFGTLMQNFAPDKYVGKKIRMTGFMKSKDVDKWAGFWLRMNKTDSKTILDNMYPTCKGNTEWTKYELVLEVPETTKNIAFDALLNGKGQIWFNNINFEIVDNSVPSTKKVKEEPTNLNFDK
ncbi:MAG: hypothetical protein IPG85_07755 [Bacteroidetes bacterium]|nr:hypothetical protein [Bacteroidota bacterium]